MAKGDSKFAVTVKIGVKVNAKTAEEAEEFIRERLKDGGWAGLYIIDMKAQKASN